MARGSSEKRYELKMEVLGPNAGQTEEVRVLNRIIRWTRTGLEYEPAQRHEEGHFGVEGAEMDDKEAHRFRALTARLNYLAGDRPDLLFASKSICKNMARPRSEDWLALKRVG